MFDGFALPAPIDWQKFERVCRDLWAEIWDDPNTQAHGRSGQPQNGVDVFGVPKGSSGYSGVQCKRRGNSADPGEISEEELRAEVVKAHEFRPALTGYFILATTGPRDAKIQAVARRISTEHQAKGLFSVHVWSWDDIQAEIGKRPQVFARHFGDIIQTVRELDRTRIVETVAMPAYVASVFSDRNVPSHLVVHVSHAAVALDPEHQAQIDSMRLLLKRGQPLLALQQAEELRARVWTAASPSAKARILAVLGQATLELGDDEAAGRLLVQTVDHAPNDPTSEANAALGHLVLGDERAAATWARKALAQTPTEPIAMQVAVLLDPRPDEDVFAEQERIVGRKFELFFALGHRALARGELDVARGWFEKGIELAPDNPDVSGIAGQILIEQIAGLPHAPYVLRKNDSIALHRGLELVGRAWERLQEPRMRKVRSGWLVSKAKAQRLLGDVEGAAKTADEVLATADRHSEHVILRAAIAAAAGDHRGVITLLKDVTEANADALGLRAAAKANLGDAAGSIADWEHLLALDLSRELREQAEQNYAHALVAAQRVADARATAERWAAECPVDLSRQLVAIEIAAYSGERGRRDELLANAIVLARSDAPARLLLRLGDALMRGERFDDAADIYTVAIPIESDDPYSRRKIQALYQAGRFESAIEACRRLVECAGLTRFTTEMESVIHEQLGDLNAARGICEKHLLTYPRDTPVLLRLATIQHRCGDPPAVARALNELDFETVEGDVWQSGMLAQLLADIGRPGDALEVLFQSRRRNMDRAAAHLQYVTRHTFLAREIEYCAVAEAGVAVELGGAGAPGWILLSDEDDANLAHNEYPVTHPVARAVLGKCVGDQVTFRENPTTQWRVIALDSKYAFALRQSLQLFTARFPTELGLEQHHVPEGRTDQFIEQVKSRLELGEPHRELVLREYAAGHLTIGGVAIALQRTFIDAIGAVSTSEAGLVGSTGTQQEKAATASLLSAPSVELVADATAILLLDELGVLRDGTLRDRKLAVTQSTVDEFRGELMRWRQHPDEGFLSIGLLGGQLVRMDTTSEQIVAARERFEHVISWIQANCAITPVPPRTAEANAKRGPIATVIGSSFWDSILIASAPGRGLLSDDLRLRQLLEGEFGRPGACSPLLLFAETEAGRLASDRYAECMVKLICSGYRFISIDARVLQAAAKMESWRPQGRLLRVLDALKGPLVEPGSAAIVAAQFFRLIWLDVALPPLREALCIAVLDALRTGRRVHAVMSGLKAHVRNAFVLLPLAEREVQSTIAAWERFRIV